MATPFWDRSVRYRLLAIALTPALIILPLVLGVCFYRWSEKFDALTTAKVRNDLVIAEQYLDRLEQSQLRRIDAVAASAGLDAAVDRTRREPGALGLYLESAARSQGLDFLFVITDDGAVFGGDPQVDPAAVRRDRPSVRAALAGQARTDLEVFEPAELRALAPGLAERARIGIVDPSGRAAAGGGEVDRGLVLQSARAIALPGGRTGVLVGGVLLNRNLAFVDRINSLVYHGGGLLGADKGTATLFLDDVRISTNVRLFDQDRAVGTRASPQVRDAVLDRGDVWLGRALVVDDWYISAYEPLTDSQGRRVGMLYVGFQEHPFVAARREALWLIVGAFLLAVLATVPLFLFWARGIFRPLERMVRTIDRIEAGDASARIGALGGQDEIGAVVTHFDRLLDQVQERDAELRRWNERLNRRVNARTREVRQAMARLEAATEQLVMSAKLAALGEMAAGVAHEINNPVAVIQGNVELIRDTLGPRADEMREEFQLLDDQIRRISRIVNNILQFAHANEPHVRDDLATADELIAETLPLVHHALAKGGVAVARDERATRRMRVDKAEVQQILINVIINAVHAMPGGGRVILKTRDSDLIGRPGVTLEVIDNGPGITPEVLERIFDPFFTTRLSGGTGLGLSISQMLMARQEGVISASNGPDGGAVFTLWFPQSE